MRTPPRHSAPEPATSLGTRLAVIGLIALVLVFGAFALANSHSSLRTLEANAQSAMRDQEAAMRDMIALFDGAMRTASSPPLPMPPPAPTAWTRRRPWKWPASPRPPSRAATRC